jgi:hypothetical protein
MIFSSVKTKGIISILPGTSKERVSTDENFRNGLASRWVQELPDAVSASKCLPDVCTNGPEYGITTRRQSAVQSGGCAIWINWKPMLRTLKISWRVTLLGFGLLIAPTSPAFAWGWLVGGAFGTLNLWGGWHLFGRVFRDGTPIRRRVGVFVLKSIGVLVLVIGVIRFLSVSPTGFAWGFGVPLVVVLLRNMQGTATMGGR